MIPEVYRPGELTASMCSPWTHDFRDCACQYWAANHPDIVLGPVHGHALEDGTSRDDAAQAVTFLDWMRRRGTAPAVMAEATLERSRSNAYDPYEINLRWQELDFVLQGEETDGTPQPKSKPNPNEQLNPPYPSTEAAMADLREELAPLEFTLSMVYLYALFSLRAPDEVSAEERRTWPGLAEDLAAARQSLLAVAVSEMTHLRWVNQMLWTLGRAGFDTQHPYTPVVRPLPPPSAAALPHDLHARVRMLRPASPKTLEDFVDIERPAETIDTEYAGLVAYLRHKEFPAGLHELAVRIDSDGLQHYQRFRTVASTLSRYAKDPRLYLRPIVLADARDASLMPALDLLDRIVKATEKGYEAEFRDDMPGAEAAILEAREAMRAFQIEAERLARDEGKGIPFFARWEVSDRAP